MRPFELLAMMMMMARSTGGHREENGQIDLPNMPDLRSPKWWEVPVALGHLIIAVIGMIVAVAVTVLTFVRDTQTDIILLKERQAFVLRYIDTDQQRGDARWDQYVRAHNELRDEIQFLRQELIAHRAIENAGQVDRAARPAGPDPPQRYRNSGTVR